MNAHISFQHPKFQGRRHHTPQRQTSLWDTDTSAPLLRALLTLWAPKGSLASCKSDDSAQEWAPNKGCSWRKAWQDVCSRGTADVKEGLTISQLNPTTLCLSTSSQRWKPTSGLKVKCSASLLPWWVALTARSSHWPISEHRPAAAPSGAQNQQLLWYNQLKPPQIVLLCKITQLLPSLHSIPAFLPFACLLGLGEARWMVSAVSSGKQRASEEQKSEPKLLLLGLWGGLRAVLPSWEQKLGTDARNHPSHSLCGTRWSHSSHQAAPSEMSGLWSCCSSTVQVAAAWPWGTPCDTWIWRKEPECMSRNSYLFELVLKINRY